jgi:hypothetical protein
MMEGERYDSGFDIFDIVEIGFVIFDSLVLPRSSISL